MDIFKHCWKFSEKQFMKIKETGSEVVFSGNDANLALIDKIQFTNLL